jgi:hypothetical protein
MGVGTCRTGIREKHTSRWNKLAIQAGGTLYEHCEYLSGGEMIE